MGWRNSDDDHTYIITEDQRVFLCQLLIELGQDAPAKYADRVSQGYDFLHDFGDGY